MPEELNPPEQCFLATHSAPDLQVSNLQTKPRSSLEKRVRLAWQQVRQGFQACLSLAILRKQLEYPNFRLASDSMEESSSWFWQRPSRSLHPAWPVSRFSR